MPSPCNFYKNKITFLLLLSFLLFSSLYSSGGDLSQSLEITWGEGRAQMLGSNQLLSLSLDRVSGSGFRSKNMFLFGKIDIQIKLVPGNSAGTVTAYYLRSQGSTWDEIDFEFLGNLSGDPYVVHTNIYTQGQGNREQQFYLWFDPTSNFHTFSILWNPQCIIMYVDGVPIREFKNNVSIGIPFPMMQPMRIYGSQWDAEDWATRGGLVKTNWTDAPFTAYFRNFSSNACVWSFGALFCTAKNSSGEAWITQGLDATGQALLKWVQKNYMIYNYCSDFNRFPTLPPECALH